MNGLSLKIHEKITMIYNLGVVKLIFPFCSRVVLSDAARRMGCAYKSCKKQLGMMVIAVGLSSYNVALFHLISHAFFYIGCM
jgi:NADH:ubiquinone oxidoreductase subunit 5 (subunit L)/multisubunit Na+/H+ antiporter MnhA subunit